MCTVPCGDHLSQRAQGARVIFTCVLILTRQHRPPRAPLFRMWLYTAARTGYPVTQKVVWDEFKATLDMKVIVVSCRDWTSLGWPWCLMFFLWSFKKSVQSKFYSYFMPHIN